MAHRSVPDPSKRGDSARYQLEHWQQGKIDVSTLMNALRGIYKDSPNTNDKVLRSLITTYAQENNINDPFADRRDDDDGPPQSTEQDRIDALLESSGTRGERSGIFRDFLSGQAQGQFINPRFQALQNKAFNPLSAEFLLQNAQALVDSAGVDDPQQREDFRSFIDRGGSRRARATRGFDFQGGLEQFSGLFEEGAQLNEEQKAALQGFTGDRNVGQNLAFQSFLKGRRASGPFGKFLANSFGESFGALADIDPLIDPFTQFARRGFRL